jgi:toxin YhaV
MKKVLPRAAAPAEPEEKHAVNGWTLYAHPLFAEQYEALVAAVEAEKKKDPATYRNSNAAKLLYAVEELVNRLIPANPAHKKYRQGDALGAANKNWFRAKFYQQFRLFFRFDSRSKTIVYAWVNDETTLRAYDSKTDAYRTFKKMLDRGNPPGSFDDLLDASRAIAKKTS